MTNRECISRKMQVPATIIKYGKPIIVQVTIQLPEEYSPTELQLITVPTFLHKIILPDKEESSEERLAREKRIHHRIRENIKNNPIKQYLLKTLLPPDEELKIPINISKNSSDGV